MTEKTLKEKISQIFLIMELAAGILFLPTVTSQIYRDVERKNYISNHLQPRDIIDFSLPNNNRVPLEYLRKDPITGLNELKTPTGEHRYLSNNDLIEYCAGSSCKIIRMSGEAGRRTCKEFRAQ